MHMGLSLFRHHLECVGLNAWLLAGLVDMFGLKWKTNEIMEFKEPASPDSSKLVSIFKLRFVCATG